MECRHVITIRLIKQVPNFMVEELMEIVRIQLARAFEAPVMVGLMVPHKVTRLKLRINSQTSIGIESLIMFPQGLPSP